MLAGCDRATRLVDQMLTLARLDPAQPRPFVSCNLGPIVRAALAEAAPSAMDKSIEVELVGADAHDVTGDPALLAILARNLIDNAVRYGTPGTRVRASVMRHADTVELEVADDGPGVPPAELGRLGERFYRRTGTGETGSGLGLSIVRRIAEVHGGTVQFRAAETGTGLVVSVRLPAGDHAALPSANPG